MSEFLWVEKYRPKKISECILTEELKNTFTQFLKQKEIPNLLLSGSAGTGKTTVARALCEELHCDYIIINGSDEGRQIAVEDILEEFGDLPTFEKGLYFDWSNYQNASDEDKELADKVQEFVDEHDYDREEDCWTMNKGGYDVDTEIVDEFTMETPN